MQNIRIGVNTSIAPVGVKPSRSVKWPSWKIHTIAPNVAVRLSMLSSERLDRHEQAAGHQEQQDERDERDEAERERQPVFDRALGVDELAPTDPRP